jgi:predicted phosphoribosyltransferase
MRPETALFKDRAHAGALLADKLKAFANRDDVMVIGLPRGGVPVAYEVARRLHAPLDVIVVRKLGVPGWEELAMGAVASGGVRILNDEVIQRAGITPLQIKTVTLRELDELRRREQAYRGRAGAPDVEGKTVILIDDGLATGATMHSAVRGLRPQDPAEIIVAVPVASGEACELLRSMADKVVSLLVPDDFGTVGQFYQTFGQTSDEEVTRLLGESHQHAHSPATG